VGTILIHFHHDAQDFPLEFKRKISGETVIKIVLKFFNIKRGDTYFSPYITHISYGFLVFNVCEGGVERKV